LGPCYVCTQLNLAGKARDSALAEAQEIIRRAEEAYATADAQAYHEVTEVCQAPAYHLFVSKKVTWT
jgi:hypothetical protein